MRSGRVKLVAFSQLFTSTGTFDPYTDPIDLSLQELGCTPILWSMQVTGLAADGKTVASLTSWNVLLLGSNDGLTFTNTSILLQHTNTAQANGDVVWPSDQGFGNTGPGQFRGIKYVRLNIQALVLNVATQIKVSVEGY